MDEVTAVAKNDIHRNLEVELQDRLRMMPMNRLDWILWITLTRIINVKTSICMHSKFNKFKLKQILVRFFVKNEIAK